MKKLLAALGLTLVLLAPFLNKPFNVDEPFYLASARQILSDPLHPYNFTINWSGENRHVWERMEATYPPLVPYYTAAVMKLFGERPWVLHLFFLVFPLSAAAAMFLLARRFTARPLACTALLVAAPAFLVSSNSVMLDIPLLAALLASLAFFVYGTDRDSHRLLAAGALLAGAALLIKYSAVLLFPLVLWYLFLTKKPKYVLYLAVPVVIFALWCLENQLVYGGMHFFRASSHVGKGFSLHKLLASASFFGGTMVFPLFLFGRAGKKEAVGAAAGTALLLGLSLALFPRTGTAVLFTLFAAGSLYFVYRIAAVTRRADPFLLGWFWIALAMAVLLEPWSAARYLLLVLPPAAMLFVSFLGEGGKRLLAAAFGATLLLGLSCAVADYQWARAYERFAEHAREAGFARGAFLGHFGFQYYMEKAGMVPLDVNATRLAAGDYLIAAALPDPQRPSRELVRRLRPVGMEQMQSSFPLRLMDPAGNAGFYSSFWGVLPYSFSSSPLDTFTIFAVTE